MQAALMLRSKSRVARRRKLRKLGGRLELPSNVATKEIAPFPRYPPESWCAQGRAAWLERGRRCSVQESQQQATCHRRWVKRNRIQDASLGGSSDDEDFLGVLRGPSTFANAFLYVGLGTVALGLVIAFVGTGEKGFKTVELRLIGPSLIGLGLICCILRILFCICPSHCIASNKKARKKNGNKIDADHTTSLLRGESKRVSIARGPSFQPKYPLTHKRSQSRMLNEGMEALRQIATTSLFMQNEQKPSMNRIVPIIKEPESAMDAPLEMKKLDNSQHPGDGGDKTNENDQPFNHTGNIIMVATAPTTTTTTTAQSTAEQVKATTAAKAKSATTTTTASSRTTTAAVATKNTNSTTTTTNNNNINTSNNINLPPPQGTVTNSVGKLTRQRVAFNQHEQPLQKQQPAPHSKSLTSSSAVKESIEEDLLMETSLTVTTASTLIREDRPPLSTISSKSASNTSNNISSTPQPMQSKTTSSSYTGAISRISNSTIPTPGTVPTSTSFSFDLPPATPHTYNASTSYAAAAMSTRSDRETLIRGPLGMTASPSTYTLPASASATSVTTPSSISGKGSLLSSTTPAVPTSTVSQHASIPGQVLDLGPSTSAYARLGSSFTGGISSSLPQTSQLPVTSSPLNYQFPSSLLSSSNVSSASSNGRKSAVTSQATTLAPPPTPPINKFEPELLLSPAKLGQ